MALSATESHPFLKTIEEDGIEEIEEKPEIPETYLQELFFLNPLNYLDSELKGRERELLLIQQAYENWPISHRPLLMVGEAGTGMSTLLNYSQAQIFPDAHLLSEEVNISNHNDLLQLLIKELGVTEARNFSDLTEALKSETTPKVFIFENVERLFLRRIHGFDLLREFLLFVHASRNSIFWLITINEYSYYYLSRSIDFSDHFLSTIKVSPMSNENIEEILTAHNRNYELLFLKPNDLSRRLKRKVSRIDKQEKQAILLEQFNNRLHQFAEGNISRALMYWLNSIVRFKENKIYLRPYQANGTLKELSLEDLFIWFSDKSRELLRSD